MLCAEFARNNANPLTTLASPFLANYGQHPRIEFEPLEPLPPNLNFQIWVKLIAAKKFVDQMSELQSHLHDEMLIAQAIYEL